MADSKGRDSNEALIFVTGAAAFAPVDELNVPTKSDLGDPAWVAPSAFKFLGLRTSDGGPEGTSDAGDAIEFLEEGFDISGSGSKGVTMTLAQYNSVVREFVHGKAPDANGVIEVDSSTPNNQFILLLEAIYKGGQMKREVGVGRITEAQVGKDERGNVTGVTVTVTWQPHELFNRAPYWEAVVEAPAPVEPTP